eukprot:5130526-Alexandrium_andersonii.AAC.1
MPKKGRGCTEIMARYHNRIMHMLCGNGVENQDPRVCECAHVDSPTEGPGEFQKAPEQQDNGFWMSDEVSYGSLGVDVNPWHYQHNPENSSA